MIDPKVIAVAEIRRTELFDQAEQHRLARLAVSSSRGGKEWGRVWRDELTALRSRMSAMRRHDLASPSDLAPAATETT